jgi:hypothetical protein
MGLVDDIRRNLGPKCAQLVHYDGRTLNLPNLSVPIAGGTATVGAGSISAVKIRDVSEAAAALDAMQFAWCQAETDPNLSKAERHDLALKRVAAVGMITGLRLALVALQTSPSSTEVQTQVNSWLEATRTFLTPPPPVASGPPPHDLHSLVDRSPRRSPGGSGGLPLYARRTAGSSSGDATRLWSHLGLDQITLGELAAEDQASHTR